MFIKFKFNKAFTITEVLITLVVIGIIAALTIPNLIQNTIKQQTVVSVKKYQSFLEQAIKKYALDNGCVGDLSLCGAYANIGGNHTQAWNGIKPYFSIAKDCGTATGQGCWAKGVMYKFLNGDDDVIIDDSSTPKAILADGASIRIYDYSGNCDDDRSRNDNSPVFYLCGYLAIDTNGNKGPNQIGRDVFWWYVTKYGVYPSGLYDDSSFSAANGTPLCDPSSGSNAGTGYGCTAKILKEGAINY